MASKYRCNLDEPLLKLSSQDVFTIRDALAGVSVFGATGGGKTSGSGQHLAHALLKGAGGFGGLVMIAKPEEVLTWERYAMDTGRIRSLIVFDETQGFNFLTYALAKQGVQGIGSVVETLMAIVEATRRQQPGGNGGDGFWQDSMRQLGPNERFFFLVPILRQRVNIKLQLVMLPIERFFIKTAEIRSRMSVGCRFHT